jgi:hypothetical protein
VRNVLAVLAPLALAAALTACGGTSGAGPVAAAAAKSERAGGVKVALDVRFSVGGIAGGVVVGTGRFAPDAGELDIDMSNLLQFLSLPVGSGGGVREIYLIEKGVPVVYMHIPFLADQLPAGKRWIRLDLDQAGGALGIDFDKLLGQSGTNPTQTLAMLRASREVKKVGPDVVSGLNVTQYHATIDLKQALKLNGVSADGIKSLLDSGAPQQFPVEVWVGDDDGLVHRLRMTQTSNVGGKSVTTLTTMTLTDWGSKVVATAPPAAQVFDATALTSGNKKA